MASHVRAFAVGDAVSKPTYDHHLGTFGPEEVLEPGEIVIVEGLLPLADRSVRDAIDVGVFLEPEETLRRRWKLERDVFERGYAPKDVVAELRRREPDAARYVTPQREFADVIVRFHRQPTPPMTRTFPPASSCAPRCRSRRSASCWAPSARGETRPSAGPREPTGAGR